jgi:hypothetical protein
MVYGDSASGLSFQLPLVTAPQLDTSVVCAASAAFPHCSGICEASDEWAMPPMLPILTIDGRATAPSCGGKSISTGLGSSREFLFRYEQPDLFSLDGEQVLGVASCKVQWSFRGNRIQAEFSYAPKRALRLERFDFAVPACCAQPCCHPPASVRLGEGGLRPQIILDDFHGDWEPPQSGGQAVTLLRYRRLLPMLLQVGHGYRFIFSLDLDIVREQP